MTPPSVEHGTWNDWNWSAATAETVSSPAAADWNHRMRRGGAKTHQKADCVRHASSARTPSYRRFGYRSPRDQLDPSGLVVRTGRSRTLELARSQDRGRPGGRGSRRSRKGQGSRMGQGSRKGQGSRDGQGSHRGRSRTQDAVYSPANRNSDSRIAMPGRMPGAAKGTLRAGDPLGEAAAVPRRTGKIRPAGAEVVPHCRGETPLALER
jgi:hypothetical protein